MILGLYFLINDTGNEKQEHHSIAITIWSKIHFRQAFNFQNILKSLDIIVFLFFFYNYFQIVSLHESKKSKRSEDGVIILFVT